jgi:ABC-type amino acid transport substrate-binding protein
LNDRVSQGRRWIAQDWLTRCTDKDKFATLGRDRQTRHARHRQSRRDERALKAYWLQRDEALKAFVDQWLHISMEDGSFGKIYAAWFE